MKFALRDDDINFFYSPDDIIKNYNDIWDICPVSMSIIPFVKGNWNDNVAILEKYGPNGVPINLMDKIVADNVVYPIHNNPDLISFLKNQIELGRVHITLHGVYHRGEGKDVVRGNFSIGAEFAQKKDLTEELRKAIDYVEPLFEQKILFFTPPQNLLDGYGYKSILNNGLSLCTDIPTVKSISSIKILGIVNYIRILKNRVLNGGRRFFSSLILNSNNYLIDHYRLQPGTNLQKLYEDFDYVHKNNGIFVLSTHSYAFDYMMKDRDTTMGRAMKDLINYAKSKGDVEFVSIDKIT